jgi:hypothetical protein
MVYDVPPLNRDERGDETNLPVATAFSEKDTIIFDLQKQLDTEKSKNKYLEDQIRIRVTAFINREASAKKIVDALENKLSQSIGDDQVFNSKLKMLRELHASALHSIDQLQANTITILQSQEQELMRGFRQRFGEVSQEIDSLRNKKGDFNTELQTRLKRLTAELLSCQELCQILEAKNAELFAENKKLNETIRSQQDDRQALLMELVVLKRSRENHGSTTTSKKHRVPTKLLPTPQPDHPASPTKPRVASHVVPESREENLRVEIQNLQKQLKLERLASSELRAENQGLYGEEDEMKKFLVHCVNDVKTAVAKRQHVPIASVADFSDSDRRKVLLELLQSIQH